MPVVDKQNQEMVAAPTQTKRGENTWDEDMELIAESWHNATYWWGCMLLAFAVSVVLTGIFTEKNNPPYEHAHWFLDLLLFWSMLFWISMLEGCQISVVGLQGYDPETFRTSHPRAYQCCKLVHTGANVERFLVGRQFLLLFNGFLVSRIGGGQAIDHFKMGNWEWGLEMTQFFFSNGVLLMIVIVALGQLPTQLVAADKMLGFFELPLNHYWLVLRPCMFVEWLGFTHSSYILKDFLCWVSGIDVSKADPEKELNKDAIHWLKCGFSLFAVGFSGTFITKGIAKSQTNATTGAGWQHLSGGAAVAVSFLFVFMLASAEGIQVALLHPDTATFRYKKEKPLAYRTAKLALSGRNMAAFLAGRQFLTAMNMVLLAKVTSYAGGDGKLLPGGDWGMGETFNEYLLQWGFLGAIFVVNVAQLASQVTASIFPIPTINNYFMYWLLRLMLFIEFIGIVNACWFLAYLMERYFEMDPDPPLRLKRNVIDTPERLMEGRVAELAERIANAGKGHGDLMGMSNELRSMAVERQRLQNKPRQRVMRDRVAELADRISEAAASGMDLMGLSDELQRVAEERAKLEGGEREISL